MPVAGRHEREGPICIKPPVPCTSFETTPLFLPPPRVVVKNCETPTPILGTLEDRPAAARRSQQPRLYLPRSAKTRNDCLEINLRAQRCVSNVTSVAPKLVRPIGLTLQRGQGIPERPSRVNDPVTRFAGM